MPACEWDTPDEKCQEDAIVKINMQFSDFYVCVEHYTELKRIYPPIMDFPMQLITEVLGE
jgi:hypothetical protein